MIMLIVDTQGLLLLIWIDLNPNMNNYYSLEPL